MKNFILSITLFMILGNWGQAAPPERIRFNRDVRPILSGKCFHCHGFDEQQRQGNLRLDEREGAIADLGGHAAVVPGDVQASELVKRIYHSDPEMAMPPPDSLHGLSESDRAVLTAWIEQGAEYDLHWAFVPPTKNEPQPNPEIPAGWNQNPIDRWIADGLRKRNLAPASRAAPEKWLRRASLDVLGLAPTPEETDVFLKAVAARGEQAYVDRVEEWLSSPRFGERMAQDWLDVARYADTHGFNNDSERIMWRWRDWVIDAFNDDLPYDQFLIKQIAGDLLPNPTLDDQVATGFCRNHVINSEGGIIDEEYRVEYVVDRVRTLGTGVLGLTMECARCHDHKFDPISQKEFYQLYAFFNQVDEVGEDGRDRNPFPIIKAPTESQAAQTAKLQQQLETRNSQLEQLANQSHFDASALTEESLATHLQMPTAVGSSSPKLHVQGPVLIEATPYGMAYSLQDATSKLEWELPSDANFATKPWTFTAWVRWNGKEMPLLSSMNLIEEASSGGHGRGMAIEIGASGQIEVKLGSRWRAYSLQVQSEQAIAQDQWSHVAVSFDGTGSADGVAFAIQGEQSASRVLIDGFNNRDTITHPFKPRLGSEYSKTPRWNSSPIALPTWYSKNIPFIEFSNPVAALQASQLLALPSRTSEQNSALARLAMRLSGNSAYSESFAKAWRERELLKSEMAQHLRSIPTTMVMKQGGVSRDTFVLYRGQYQSPREQVQPDVPNALQLPWGEGAVRNRLGLALWLTDPKHPLTSRVAVNRLWQQFFGVGIVKTVEDFGVQGEYPVHPELLDYLACDLIESGWSIKAMIRKIVLSETYRQDSGFVDNAHQIDPENRWLARGPRVRLPAETVRDHLLNLGGLLRHRLGGPSVFPVQPEDLYQGIVVDAPYAGTKWVNSQGDDLYRRSLYTFWKRTVPYPVLNLFDAPDREVCVGRRSRTNTPLQALTLMNEPSMLEAARGLAQRMNGVGSEQANASLRFAFVAATGRQPTEKEIELLDQTHRKLLREFEGKQDEASALLGASTIEPDTIQKAAMVAMASIILNLDETITKD